MSLKRRWMLGAMLPLAMAWQAQAATASAIDAEDAVDVAARASLGEWVEFLKLPNVTTRSTAEIRDNADWAEAAFRRHGYVSRQLEDNDTPMVYAEWPDTSPERKTVLFYAHMDGQAVFPKEWDQPDPFIPVLKHKAADGSWQVLPIESLQQKRIDREWRLFARSSADDKAPIMMLLAAMDALRAEGKSPAINVKVILDSHEEGGPPTLKDVVERNRELLDADAVVMLDGPMHISNRPTLVFGHRGGGGFRLTVHAARSELHSGHYGNFSPDPSIALAELVATFKDPDGRVKIPGFYDGVEFSPAYKQAMAEVPDDQAAIRRRIGIAAQEKVGDNYQEAMNYPTLNITAMKSGEIESRRSIIPASASATFGIRTVPATPPERQVALVRRYIEAQGYHLVDGEPTEAERLAYPKLATFTGGGGMKALQTPLDAPIGQWARAALLKTFGQEPVNIPIMGGGVPSQALVDGMGVPILLIPLVNADNNQHAANENMRLGNYFDGVRSLHALFQQPF